MPGEVFIKIMIILVMNLEDDKRLSLVCLLYYAILLPFENNTTVAVIEIFQKHA